MKLINFREKLETNEERINYDKRRIYKGKEIYKKN